MNFKSIESFGKKVLKTGIAIGLAASAESPVQAENFKSNDNDPDKIESVTELKENNPTPESYDAFEKIKNVPRAKEKRQKRLDDPMGELLEDIRYSEPIVCFIKIENLKKDANNLNEELGEIDSKLSSLNKNSSEYLKELEVLKEKHQKFLSTNEEIKKINKRVEEIYANKNNFLGDENLKSIYENSTKILNETEQVRKELIDIVSTKNYLKKLQSEFNCSLDEAKRHQAVRINNLKTVLISFKNSIELGSNYFGNTPAGAKYFPDYHEIYLPYNRSSEKINRFAFHELLHALTNGDNGLSAKAVKTLSYNASNNKNYDKSLNEYLLRPTERYVRLKMLELELDKLGIKKFGERISKSGYKKMIQWLEESKYDTDFSADGVEFLETTKGLDNENGRQVINSIFEEIADNQEMDNQNDYKHPGWDYNNPENLA